MFQTRILYHPTNGIRTDHGWSYKRVETQEQFDHLMKEGWFESVTDLLISQQASASVSETEPEIVSVEDNTAGIIPFEPLPEPEANKEAKPEAGPKKGRPRKKG